MIHLFTLLLLLYLSTYKQVSTISFLPIRKKCEKKKVEKQNVEKDTSCISSILFLYHSFFVKNY